MKCFCGRRATGGPCRWPVERFEPATYADLKVDDVVRRWKNKLDHRPPATVYSIEPIGTEWVKIVLTIVRGKRPLYKDFTVMLASRVRRLEQQYCNADTCEFHHVELSEKKHICVDHWRALQEGIAA